MHDKEKVEELMGLFFSDDLRICQMASFSIITIADHAIESLEPYLPHMISHYRKAPHDAFRRNVMRLFQFVDLPEELEGSVYDLCLEDFCDTKAPTAVRVFGLTTMCNICIKHLGLAQELLPILKDYQGTGTVGFENRLKKEINRISNHAKEN